MHDELRILGRGDIEAAADTEPTPFHVPEWGGSVLLRPLMGWERDDWDRQCSASKESGDIVPQHFRARLVRMALVGPDGRHLYSEKPEELKALSRKGAAALDRLFTEVCRRAGMGQAAAEAAEKNSEPARSGSSGSNSPTATESPSAASSES